MTLPKMHAYQEKALKHCNSMLDSYLALDMGLGKSLIALEWLKDKAKGGVLIIAPLKACYTTWPDEIEKWQMPYTYTILHGKDKTENIGLKRNLYITNFESIKWLFTTLKDLYKITKKVPFRTDRKSVV